jgi:type II secretory pathway predicted ATPase ExeA
MPPFLTYEPYYELKEKPFSLSSDPRFLYKSRSHALVYDDLRAGILRREGVIVLTGDIGTGKTTICRAVLNGLDRKTFSAFLPDPFVSREDLLKTLLIDFGVMSVDELKSSRFNEASRLALSYPLYDFLRTLVPLQAFAVLMIDEAQNLSLPLLEELRILSDLEGPEKLLQVVLIGQLELLPKLKDPKLRQLDQRVSVRCELQPLDRAGVSAYIAHRLGVADGGSHLVKFSDEATDLIYNATKGNPRLINLVCDRALHLAHLAKTGDIGTVIARKAVTEIGVTKLTPPAEVGDPNRVEARFFAETVPPAVERRASPKPPQPAADPAPEPAQHTDRRAVKWVAAAVVGLAVGVLAVTSWNRGSTDAAQALTLPSFPQPPVNRYVVDPRLPVSSRETASPSPVAGRFEVGVALFARPTRARTAEIELAAAGYHASTRALMFGRGHMYEVRTGPYATRVAAEADAARIRSMGSYSDARVLPPTPAVQ